LTWQFERHSGTSRELGDQWIGYCAFHLGDYKRALKEFQNLTADAAKTNPEDWMNLACCYFYLGMYPEAEEVWHY
jgi:intraflagellar transport protein 56